MNLATETAIPGDTATAGLVPTLEEIARHFPQLDIVEFLGRGGMGVVYKARQKSLGRCVALKLLAPERAGDPQFALRFEKEARALATLNHPNIVAVHDFGQAGGFYYLLMEFVNGVNLRQAMLAGHFTPEQALAIVPPFCEALQYAHEHGIVHRDIKPENLLLDKEGRVKIADFGVAKIVGAETSAMGLAESQPAGTPQYMAPEQKSHAITDHRADIYSLGVVLYEMLTGELPAEKIQPPSRRVEVDVRIDEIVLRALEKAPELRYQTAAEFRTHVETIPAVTQSSAAPAGSRFSRAAIAAAPLALIIGAAGWLIADGAPPPLVMVGFAGLAAFLTVVTLVRSGLNKPGAAKIAMTPKSITAAIGVAIFFGIMLIGIPFVDMFRVRKDPAYVTVVLVALTVSVLTAIRAWSSISVRSGPRRWYKPLAFVALLAAIPAIGLTAFFVPNLRHGFDNPSPSEALLVPLCFVGALALPIAGLTLWRASKSAAGLRETPPEEPGTSHFSRAAIVGACWVPAAIFAFLIAYLMLESSRRAVSPTWRQLVVIMPLLAVAVSAPFGTTVLGWIAISQIRRSSGRIHGLALAMFDGLLFPLMALSSTVAVAGVALAKMFVDFFGNLSLIGNPSAHPPLLTRLANDVSQNMKLVLLLSVLASFVVDVFILRFALRAVRKDAAAAPPENSVSGNQIKLASLALIFALMGAAFGACAVIRVASAWQAVALAFLFAGFAIFMALPVRHLAAGKCALVVAALGLLVVPLATLWLRQTRVGHNAQFPGIAQIEVTQDWVRIVQPRYDSEGMLITFGPASNRWTPSGVFLEAMFDVTLEPHMFSRGATWVIKPRHGIHSNYRLDGPPGPMLGKVVFLPGAPSPDAEGAYVIGEFRPEKGEPLAIAARLEKDKPPDSFPTGAHISSNHLSVVVTHNQRGTELHYVLLNGAIHSIARN